MQLPKPPPRHEKRVLAYALLGGLPGVAATGLLLWYGDYSTRLLWTVMAFVVLFWLGFSFAVRERVIFPLRTLSNLLAALREGDYTLRARAAKDDAMGEVMTEVNLMSAMLREQRLSALEATQLLRTVMEEIDVAVFAFDADNRLRLMNRAAERLLGAKAEKLLDLTAKELDLDEFLVDHPPRAAEREFPGAAGRWRVSRSSFRQHGVQHQLLVLSDVTRELRAEETAAWQRLVRVLGHELNNSLAPVKSLAGSLRSLLSTARRPGDWEKDMGEGLGVIESRVDSLSRFTGSYTRLAKLPAPRLEAVNLGACIRRTVHLETRLQIELEPGPEVTLQADTAQIEQALINLLRNGVEAAVETGGGVRIAWDTSPAGVEISIEDGGPGLSNDANLFVPFFTTKPGGSGVGLVLSRRIAESHGGSLTLGNRPDGRGCIARMILPLGGPADVPDVGRTAETEPSR